LAVTSELWSVRNSGLSSTDFTAPLLDTSLASTPLSSRKERAADTRLARAASTSSTVTTSLQATSDPTPPAANAAHGSAANPQLTDQQADLVSGLWRANVSATDIARVIERMRVERATGGQGADVNTRIDTAPPGYDFIHR
jgi:hypothetical protein